MAPRPFILPFLCLLSSAFFEAILAESIVFNIFSTRTNGQLLFVHNPKDVGANWTILPFEGEEQDIFDEVRRHIQTDDRPKAFVQIDGQTITQRLYQEPFCWLRGICWRRNRTAETFVFCNGRLAEIVRLLRMNGCESAEEKGGEEAEGTDEFNEVGWSTTFLAVEATPNGQSSKKGGKGTNSKNKLNTDGKMMSEGDQRRMCRYRLSCYEKMGFSHLIGKRQKQPGGKVLSGKMAPPEGSKRTMKQMAKVAIKGVEKSEAEGKTKKELDEKDGETVLANYRSGRERKLRCKYRKSCYRSGLRPTIESNLLALWLSGSGTKGYGEEEGNKSEKAGREAEWDTLDTKQRKVFCRYRKSCYSNGSRTMGKSDWRWDDFEIDFGFTQKTSEYWSNLRKMVKGRKSVAKKTGDETEIGGPKEEEDAGEEAQRRKLDCKYRRSCYKTGELPDAFRTPAERTEEGGAEGAAMGRKKVPTSVRELKVFCKYRKSCYLASATETETAEVMRAESSQNKTSGKSEKEEEWVGKIGEEVQRLTERQTTKRNAVANNDQTEGRREEGEEKREEEEHGAEVPKKRRNKKKKRTEVSEAPKNGEDEMKREEEKQLNRNEREQQEENRKEKKEKPKRGGQRKPKTSCSPEKWVKEKKVEPGGCREKRNKEGVEGEKEKRAEETQKKKKKTKRKEEVKLEEETNKETEATEIGGEKEEKEEKEIKEGKKQQYKQKKRTYKVQVAEVQEQKSKVWSRNWLGLSSAERLECRYRKSCYATGTRPTSQIWTIGGDEKWWRCWEWHNLWRAVPWIFEEQQKKEKADKSNKIEGWEGLSDRARKQKCQYRKSCYNRMESGEGSGAEGDEPNGRTDSARKKEKPRPRKAADFTPKTVSREADKRKREETLRREAIFKSVDMATKLHCKYRKSCYEGSADRIMAPPPIILVGKKNETVVVGGAITANKCNQWRISCREAMGLPVVEKAPVGPDGRKLCRRRKVADSEGGENGRTKKQKILII